MEHLKLSYAYANICVGKVTSHVHRQAPQAPHAHRHRRHRIAGSLGNVGGSRTCLPHDDLRAKRDFRRHHRNMEHARPGRGNLRL